MFGKVFLLQWEFFLLLAKEKERKKKTSFRIYLQ
jgi:hypothetical protein